MLFCIINCYAGGELTENKTQKVSSSLVVVIALIKRGLTGVDSWLIVHSTIKYKLVKCSKDDSKSKVDYFCFNKVFSTILREGCSLHGVRKVN